MTENEAKALLLSFRAGDAVMLTESNRNRPYVTQVVGGSRLGVFIQRYGVRGGGRSNLHVTPRMLVNGEVGLDYYDAGTARERGFA